MLHLLNGKTLEIMGFSVSISQVIRSVWWATFMVLSLTGCAHQQSGDSALGEVFWLEVKGGKKCRVWDHMHTGSGSGISREQALRIAEESWNWFTQWEYGQGYSWANAGNKNVRCENNPDGTISCVIEANPCRNLETASN